MAGEEKSLKKRDPIFSVCLVVFAIAAVAVLGSFVYDEYIKEDGVEVEFGDTVVVDYVGTYYDYYKGENAIVFDTTYESIGKDDGVAKSNSFDKTSYSDYTVNVGKRSSLAAFEDALIGHKVGDTVKIKIPAGEGYTSSVPTGKLTTGEVLVNDEMPIAQFESLYGDAPVVGQSKPITTVYGWPATATLAGDMVLVHSVTNGMEQQYIYDEDTAVLIKDISVASGKITFNYALDTSKIKVVNETTGEIQMIEVNLNGDTIYITNYLNNEIIYKTSSESDNIDLYFEIKIVSIN